MKVTVIPIVVGILGTIPKRLVKRLEDLEIIGQVETIQTTALLSSTRILRSKSDYLSVLPTLPYYLSIARGRILGFCTVGRICDAFPTSQQINLDSLYASLTNSAETHLHVSCCCGQRCSWSDVPNYCSSIPSQIHTFPKIIRSMYLCKQPPDEQDVDTR